LLKATLINAGRFQKLVKALSTIVEEGCFTADENGLRLTALDPSHVAMVDFKYPREAFEEYVCDEELKIGMNLLEFLKFLKRVEGGERVTLTYDKGKGKLEMTCERGGRVRSFIIPTIEVVEEETPSPKVFFKASAKMLTKSVEGAIKDASLVSDHVRFEVSEGQLKMKAVGDLGTVEVVWKEGSDELLELDAEEDVHATFSLSFLRDIFKAAGKTSEIVVLELSTDMPIKLDFAIPEGRLIYYLAPCIGV